MAWSFQSSSSSLSKEVTAKKSLESNVNNDNDGSNHNICSRDRRNVFITAASIISAGMAVSNNPANAEDSSLYSPKFVQEYPDFTPDASGWSYKDVKVGNGDNPSIGDRAVYEWSGYTIGYFGRPFEAKGGPKGGAFDKDLDFDRTVIGSHDVVAGVEQALMSMKPGGVRQVIVPYGTLSYPESDKEHVVVGPKPSTFSGQRALNFVLDNPRVDRTLLFNIKLVRVDKSNNKGGFIRGS